MFGKTRQGLTKLHVGRQGCLNDEALLQLGSLGILAQGCNRHCFGYRASKGGGTEMSDCSEGGNETFLWCDMWIEDDFSSWMVV